MVRHVAYDAHHLDRIPLSTIPVPKQKSEYSRFIRPILLNERLIDDRNRWRSLEVIVSESASLPDLETGRLEERAGNARGGQEAAYLQVARAALERDSVEDAIVGEWERRNPRRPINTGQRCDPGLERIEEGDLLVAPHEAPHIDP